MKVIGIMLSLCIALSLAAVNSVYAITGDEILIKVDKTTNAPKDRVATLKMVLIDKNGDEKTRELKMLQKGDTKRLIRFMSPKDVKGVGFLVLEDDKMYLYMPAFRKIRRIASHIKNESFMGTDFSYEDIAQTKYAEDYSASILEEKDSHYLLELSPKPDSDVDYSKLTMLVNKETYVYEKIEHYDKNDKLSKVMIASKVKKVDDYWMPMSMEMQDVQKDHRTTMTFSEVKHDTGLADKVFSQRYLKRY